MLELLRDPIFLRGIERIIIALGGILLFLFGFLLYQNGLKKGKGNLSVKSKFIQIMLSGEGPGLFFMAFGAILLTISLFTGGAIRGSDEIHANAKKEFLNDTSDNLFNYNKYYKLKNIIKNNPITEDTLRNTASKPNIFKSTYWALYYEPLYEPLTKDSIDPLSWDKLIDGNNISYLNSQCNNITTYFPRIESLDFDNYFQPVL